MKTKPTVRAIDVQKLKLNYFRQPTKIGFSRWVEKFGVNRALAAAAETAYRPLPLVMEHFVFNTTNHFWKIKLNYRSLLYPRYERGDK